MNGFLKSSLIWSFRLLLLIWLLSKQPSTVDSAIYNSRNECLTVATVFKIEFQERIFVVDEEIEFIVSSPVRNCFFNAEKFYLQDVHLYEAGNPVKKGLNDIGGRVWSLSMLGDHFFQPNKNYTVRFKATKVIEAVTEGIVFKIYRDMRTMLK